MLTWQKKLNLTKKALLFLFQILFLYQVFVSVSNEIFVIFTNPDKPLTKTWNKNKVFVIAVKILNKPLTKTETKIETWQKPDKKCLTKKASLFLFTFFVLNIIFVFVLNFVFVRKLETWPDKNLTKKVKLLKQKMFYIFCQCFKYYLKQKMQSIFCQVFVRSGFCQCLNFGIKKGF